jgi:hypothetical protein
MCLGPWCYRRLADTIGHQGGVALDDGPRSGVFPKNYALCRRKVAALIGASKVVDSSQLMRFNRFTLAGIIDASASYVDGITRTTKRGEIVGRRLHIGF